MDGVVLEGTAFARRILLQAADKALSTIRDVVAMGMTAVAVDHVLPQQAAAWGLEAASKRAVASNLTPFRLVLIKIVAVIQGAVDTTSLVSDANAVTVLLTTSATNFARHTVLLLRRVRQAAQAELNVTNALIASCLLFKVLRTYTNANPRVVGHAGAKKVTENAPNATIARTMAVATISRDGANP